MQQPLILLPAEALSLRDTALIYEVYAYSTGTLERLSIALVLTEL
jgi:hypothetical protein